MKKSGSLPYNTGTVYTTTRKITKMLSSKETPSTLKNAVYASKTPSPSPTSPPPILALQYRKTQLIPALHTRQHWKPPRYLALVVLLYLTHVSKAENILVVCPVLRPRLRALPVPCLLNATRQHKAVFP